VASEARQLLGREARREAILEAAATAFAAEGFSATSMEDVAEHAGVTKLILYRHFAGKEELYRAVLEQVSTRMRQEFLRVMNAAPQRGAAVRALLTVGRESPDGYRLLVFHAPREPQFEPQVRGYWDDAVQNLDAMLGSKVAEPALREWTVRSLLLYLLHEVMLWLEVGDARNDDVFIERASEGLAALVAAWTGDPQGP
jgi:AcrR family transcriptional regulator